MRESVGTGDIVLNGQVGSDDTVVAGGDEIALERTSTISIDLVDGDGHTCTSLDLSDSSSGNGIFGVLTDVDVTSQLCTATLIDNVGVNLGITDNGGVLLAGANGCAISGQARVNYRGLLAKVDLHDR